MTVGKLWQLADRPGMPSEPTIRRLIRTRPDFPVIKRGRKGRDYSIDLEAAEAFIFEHWADARRARKRAASAVDPAQPSLFDLGDE